MWFVRRAHGGALQPGEWPDGPDLRLSGTAVRRAGKTCQTVPGKVVDPAITALLIKMMTPMTLAVSLEVQRELEARAAETDALRRQHVERLRYEAELARRRYMKVDPDNRLVADALEAEWNDKLRLHADAAADYERRSREQAVALDADMRRRILGLAEQLPRIGKTRASIAASASASCASSSTTLPWSRRTPLPPMCACRAARRARWCSSGRCPSPRSASSNPSSSPPSTECSTGTAIARSPISSIATGGAAAEGLLFSTKKIAFIRTAYKLPSRHQRLRRRGMITTHEVAAKFGIARTTVHEWGRQGLIKKHYADSLNRGLWEIPSEISIIKGHGGRDAHHAAIAPSSE